MSHPVWSVIDRNKYIGEFHAEIEKMYDQLKTMSGRIGYYNVGREFIPGMQMLYDMWNENEHVTFDLIHHFAHTPVLPTPVSKYLDIEQLNALPFGAKVDVVWVDTEEPDSVVDIHSGVAFGDKIGYADGTSDSIKTIAAAMHNNQCLVVNVDHKDASGLSIINAFNV